MRQVIEQWIFAIVISGLMFYTVSFWLMSREVALHVIRGF